MSPLSGDTMQDIILLYHHIILHSSITDMSAKGTKELLEYNQTTIHEKTIKNDMI